MKMTWRWQDEDNGQIKLSDIRQKGIVWALRCNAIVPGFLGSDQNRRLLFNEDRTPRPAPPSGEEQLERCRQALQDVGRGQ